jgi:glutamyl/glutaminyl-tRNA synthetase
MGHAEPTYAHLASPVRDRRAKLSKRHGATALGDYRDAGFLPEAMFNYLANLGWSLDGETTILLQGAGDRRLRPADVSKNPAAFDPEKLAWMNGEYVRAMDPVPGSRS